MTKRASRRRMPTYEPIPLFLRTMISAAKRAKRSRNFFTRIEETLTVIVICQLLDKCRIESRHSFDVRRALVDCKKMLERDKQVTEVIIETYDHLTDDDGRLAPAQAILDELSYYYSLIRKARDFQRVGLAGRIALMCDLAMKVKTSSSMRQDMIKNLDSMQRRYKTAPLIRKAVQVQRTLLNR